jgi:hypothetical protein
MDFKEILIAEEIDKVFVSSIPKTDGFRRFFVYFNRIDEELVEYDENIEYEGDIENIIANADKVFSECFGDHSIEHTLKSLIMDAIHEEYRIMFEDYPYSIFE